jgi:hypothetical protein
MIPRKTRGLLAAMAGLGAIVGTVGAHSPVPESLAFWWSRSEQASPQVEQHVNPTPTARFLVVAGGGAPSYNEIALEKNVHYFQRTLSHMGWDAVSSTILFANGNDGQATIRYLDWLGREQFKVPDIDYLVGAANVANVESWFDRYPQTASGQQGCPAFMYFTGHGALNEDNPDNNAMILWEEALLSVQDVASRLDQWPADIPFVAMMAQCYSGSFANLIYEGGDPERPVALQSRCGFFATVKTRPSVGCTPLVNEADYRDYSSSFFAGLSGRDRLGNPVDSADYDTNGNVSFAEAHAFAKVDEATSDWPISTSETWLQRQASETDQQRILGTPMQVLLAAARPEQQYVISALTTQLGYRLNDSFTASPFPKAHLLSVPQEVLTAYYHRLKMELLNVGMEQHLRSQGTPEQVAILDKLLSCETGSW